MSDQVLKFVLSEISVARIRCKSDLCNGVIEIPLGKLSGAAKKLSCCPICSQQFQPADGAAFEADSARPLLFKIFAEAVTQLNAMKDKFEIEFGLRAPEAK
jgi:hypothetical protein